MVSIPLMEARARSRHCRSGGCFPPRTLPYPLPTSTSRDSGPMSCAAVSLAPRYVSRETAKGCPVGRARVRVEVEATVSMGEHTCPPLVAGRVQRTETQLCQVIAHVLQRPFRHFAVTWHTHGDVRMQRPTGALAVRAHRATHCPHTF